MTQPTSEEQKPVEEGDRWHGRHHRPRSSGILGALILIVLGIFLFLANQGTIGWDTWWQYFLVGLGVAFLIDGAVLRSRGQPYLTGRLISGLVLIGIGVKTPPVLC